MKRKIFIVIASAMMLATALTGNLSSTTVAAEGDFSWEPGNVWVDNDCYVPESSLHWEVEVFSDNSSGHGAGASTFICSQQHNFCYVPLSQLNYQCGSGQGEGENTLNDMVSWVYVIKNDQGGVNHKCIDIYIDAQGSWTGVREKFLTVGQYAPIHNDAFSAIRWEGDSNCRQA